jgi:hypothetical protein
MLLGHMHNEVSCSDSSLRLLTLLAVNQLGAPGTNRVKAHTKLGSTLGIHAHHAIESYSERKETPLPDALNVPKPTPRLINSFSRGIYPRQLNADSQLRRRNTRAGTFDHPPSFRSRARRASEGS